MWSVRRVDSTKDDALKGARSGGGGLLSWLWYLLLIVSLILLGGCLLLEFCYNEYVTKIVDSYYRTPVNEYNFHDTFRNEFTYYNRHCNRNDLTTKNSSDLLIDPQMSEQQAAAVMLEHGAVAVKNILTPETANNLRNYLANKHAEKLDYNEVFWESQNRLSLALGTNDHFSIGDALEEVGKSKTVRTTLEGILGKDPAIVEISTLTAMAGCPDQDIHSDSDYFGSSLLYSRTFLHSYSLFIALQDTPEAIGATTVCPGSHLCADEVLDAVCLNNGAFSVSTNGKTGRDGMLSTGDGFLFNQNIWHRGPGNRHPSKDRIMFILTFVSQKQANDYRRQGLGTYYYQRWNMWSHTYNDLQFAKTKLVQPWAGMRALGLLPSKGIPWIHQFAQQLSNGNDFYDDDELQSMKSKLLADKPQFLFSEADTWKEFIPETFHIWSALCARLYAVVFLITLVFSRRSRKRFVLLHVLIGLAFVGVYWHVSHTELAKSTSTGAVFVRPFSKLPDTIAPSIRPTTFPERNDVLIATRFDSDFLASFRHFLDYHPGNKKYLEAVDKAAQLPVQDSEAEKIVDDILAYTEFGLPTRFLYQNHANGAWEVMSKEEAVEETRRLILSRADPQIGELSRKLKNELSVHRFGELRDTPEAKSAAEKAESMLAQVFGCSSSSSDPAAPKNTCWNRSPSVLKATEQTEAVERRSLRASSSFQTGDKVWAWHDSNKKWDEATLTRIVSDQEYEVEYYFEEQAVRPLDDLRKYYSLQSGDRVWVDYDEEFFDGTITFVHPDGFCSVAFVDGDFLERVGREFIMLLDE